MASDLIRRGDVLELLYRLKEDKGCPKNYGTLLTIISRTWELPTVDAVEVVRCENCEFWIGEMYKDPTLGYCEICDRVTDNDDFCSTGIKMDGGDK